MNNNDADNNEGDSGAAYVFVRDGAGNWSQQGYLKASNTEANDAFGESVAISGNMVVVGASEEDSNATGVDGDDTNNGADGSGAVYVFIRDGATWSQQGYLKASNAGPLDNFGVSAAVSGDTVVVGADLEDGNSTGVNGDGTNNGAGGSGAAYVFVMDTDSDGISDSTDNCLNIPNGDQADVDGDGVGNACDVCDGDDAAGDSDGDGVCDDIDVCTGDDATGDTDDDGVCDDMDVCEGDDALGDSDGDGLCDDPPSDMEMMPGDCCAPNSANMMTMLTPIVMLRWKMRRRKCSLNGNGK